MEVSLAQPALNDTLYRGNLSVYAHTMPGLYVAMTLNHSGGLMLRWFRDTLSEHQVDHARRTGGDAYDLILQGASLDPSSLLVLPHFAGSGTPTFDTASKGAILGLTFGTTRTELAKAILEGLTFELRINFDLLRAGGVTIDELRAIGGGARSGLWVQLKTDILGVPVAVPRVTDAACWGAAVLAGVGAGCYADLSQAVESALHFERRYLPDPARHARYSERYALYRDLYAAVTPLNHRL
jgi:xylulokinase